MGPSIFFNPKAVFKGQARVKNFPPAFRAKPIFAQIQFFYA
jgi:hypothetical protein